MEKKTLWIHAGGSKTGSSALEFFFEYNTLYLKSNRFSYANKLKPIKWLLWNYRDCRLRKVG